MISFRSRKTGEPTDGQQPKPPRLPLWQAILLPIVSILLFLLLLEGGLALFGVNPTLQAEDPFVGFASDVPLFVPAPDGQQMVTARNKQQFFNPQSFPREKTPDTYRIFTLGGSTTYGRPYNDVTSFSGWLRELLPLVNDSRRWEVINAGGISYASYRAAHLMQELVKYQPDLFIVYTGHNEFLEERTYGEIKEMSTAIRSAASLLSRTRTWTAMNRALQKAGVTPQPETAGRDRLSAEVDAILDQSVGLDRYQRDDRLQEKVLGHYRVSLERMVVLAGSVGAKIIFVTPASSLNDCAPFKSEHTEELNAESRQRSERLLTEAKTAMVQERWDEALGLLDLAVSFDPRHADLQYRRGRVLLALERYEEADDALRQARDEDVCPLRALTPMLRIVARVAEEQSVPLVDYVDLLERVMQRTKGYPTPGQELFFDHVHPTIEGHKLLAVELVKAMVVTGLLQPNRDWETKAVAVAAAKIDARTDKDAHGLALANLARVLLWAGKNEEAARLARQARATSSTSEQVVVSSASILTSILSSNGNTEDAIALLYDTIVELPGAIELRMKLGELLNEPSYRQREKSAANLLLVCQQMPDHDGALTSYSLVMAQRGRFDIAYDSVSEALRLNPKNGRAQSILANIQKIFKERKIKLKPSPFQTKLDIYPSRAPRKLVQMRQVAGGRLVPHGIEVEFFENGRIKSFKDLVGGKVDGVVKTWDDHGKELTSLIYKQGASVSD